MRKFTFLIATLMLAGCGQPSGNAPDTKPVEPDSAAAPAAKQEDSRLAAVLDSQADDVKARYRYRHPRETMAFFGIEPGMTVVEALPGGGWYTRILLPYLGSEGMLIGADYALEMYRNFDFASDEFMEEKKTWVTDWPAVAAKWRGKDGANVKAFVFGQLPDGMKGTADAVLIIRALHNMARFNSDGGYLTTAVRNAYDVLKPGGIAGIVQHHARDDMSDEWAGGQNGYLKQDFVIQTMEEAGFEFVAASDINANANDRPTPSDVVWRLPPSLGTSADNPELRTKLEAVGESNRMTLKFRKPVP